MRRDAKGKALTRYLTGAAGIPMLHWNFIKNIIEGPPPYEFRLVTDAATWRAFEAVAASDKDKVNVVIRYDKHVGELEDSVVMMKLPVFTALLEAHYNSIQDRVETFIKGE